MDKKINNKIPHYGDILIRKVNKITGEEKKYYKSNQITKYACDELAKSLYSGTPDCEIKFLAFGSGTSTPSIDNQTLDTENYRIADTALARSDYGQVSSEFVLDGADYVAEFPSGEIEEIGFFAGSSAQSWSGGAGADTGLLISRILFSITITVDEEIYFQRIDSIEPS